VQYARGGCEGRLREAEAHGDVARLKPPLRLQTDVDLTLQPGVGALQTWLGTLASECVDGVSHAAALQHKLHSSAISGQSLNHNPDHSLTLILLTAVLSLARTLLGILDQQHLVVLP